MPSYVTGQTKTFKAYGKKNKTHTANIRQACPLEWNLSSPERASTSAIELTDNSDLSDDEWDNPPPPPKAPLRTPAKKKQPLSALVATRQVKAGRNDKENAPAQARKCASGSNNKQSDTSTAPGSLAQSIDIKGKGKAPPHKPSSGLSSKPVSLGPRRDPPRSSFIGVVIDTKTRLRTATPRTTSPQVVTLSGDESDEPARGSHSWSKLGATDDGLSARFGDIDLSDSDHDGSDDCQVVPVVAAPGKHSASIASHVSSATNTARQGRKVSSKSIVLSSSEEESMTSRPLPPPPPPAAPVRSSRHTRSASASASSAKLAPPPSPPKQSAPRFCSAGTNANGPAPSRLAFPPLLKPLLSVTTTGSPSSGAFDFTDFVRAPPAPLASTSTRWCKVGEASYSEVFSAPGVDGEDLVVKVIPISPWAVGKAPKPSRNAVEMPFMSEWHSAEREVALSSLLGGDGNQVQGFVKFKGAFLVQGNYPATLLAAWDDFKVAQSPHCDDQIRPHVLPANQVYMMIVLTHGGRDLESYKLKSWVEAASVLWQIAAVCARAEKAVEFEHRDLHWGNVLVQPSTIDTLTPNLASLALTPCKPSVSSSSRFALDSSQSGVEVTLIDFTLSRAANPRGTGVLWDGFEDECVFEGEGDTQFDVYRAMRDHVHDDWEGYHPLTNLMWIHHLSTKLLTAKKLKKPNQLPSRLASTVSSSSPRKGPVSRSAAASLSGTPRRGLKAAPPKNTTRLVAEYEAWTALKEVEKRLGEVLAQASQAKPAKGRKGRKAEVGWGCAGDLVAWWGAQ